MSIAFGTTQSYDDDTHTAITHKTANEFKQGQKTLNEFKQLQNAYCNSVDRAELTTLRRENVEMQKNVTQLLQKLDTQNEKQLAREVNADEMRALNAQNNTLASENSNLAIKLGTIARERDLLLATNAAQSRDISRLELADRQRAEAPKPQVSQTTAKLQTALNTAKLQAALRRTRDLENDVALANALSERLQAENTALKQATGTTPAPDVCESKLNAIKDILYRTDSKNAPLIDVANSIKQLLKIDESGMLKFSGDIGFDDRATVRNAIVSKLVEANTALFSVLGLEPLLSPDSESDDGNATEIDGE